MKISRWYGWAGVLVAVLALVAVAGGVSVAWPGSSAGGVARVIAAPQAPAQGTPTPTPPVGASPSTTPGRTPVAGLLDGGNGNQEAPAADNTFVVWEDNGTGTNTWDIQGRDLTTGTTFDVNVDPADQRHPAISGDLVVWQDNRNGNWDIYGAYILTDTVGPAFAVYTGPGDQTDPAVSGTTVVWQSILPTPTALAGSAPAGVGRWDVQGVDISAGQPFTLTNGTTNNISPAIDGANVVWQSAPPTSTLALTAPWTIQGHNLATGAQFGFVDTPGDEVNPVISGNTVVWQEISPTLGLGPTGVGRWTLSGGDISSGSTFTITNAPGDQMNPAIDGNQVVFQQYQAAPGDNPQGVGRWSVIETTIGSGTDTTVSDSPENATAPTLANGVPFWQQSVPDGDQDVYGDICMVDYSDVDPADYFYEPVGWLACSGVISGYADGTFRPYNNTTRGQLAKIVVLAEGFDLDATGGPHFSDVPPSSPFYIFVETAYRNNLISGYADGTFRPNANVTRGQLSKIIVTAEEWPINTTGGPHFSDVPTSNPFYTWIETAYNKGIISGYADGTFHWGADATRGQIAKIVYLAVFAP